jgi:hypothetical protein
MAEYISQKKPLGGLLILLPQMFSLENREGAKSNEETDGVDLLKNVLAELEKLLIHSKIPVSQTDINFLILSTCMLLSLFLATP